MLLLFTGGRGNDTRLRWNRERSCSNIIMNQRGRIRAINNTGQVATISIIVSINNLNNSRNNNDGGGKKKQAVVAVVVVVVDIVVVVVVVVVLVLVDRRRRKRSATIVIKTHIIIKRQFSITIQTRLWRPSVAVGLGRRVILYFTVGYCQSAVAESSSSSWCARACIPFVRVIPLMRARPTSAGRSQWLRIITTSGSK